MFNLAPVYPKSRLDNNGLQTSETGFKGGLRTREGMTWNKDVCRTEIHTPKAATYKKRHRSDGVKCVGPDQIIKANSMGTVKLTIVISGWDITEFLIPMAQKDENKQTK